MDTWIDLTEFSTKYGVSTSTLRRRIRAKTIAYKLEKGKYLLNDSQETMNSAPLFSRSQNLAHANSVSLPKQSVRAVQTSVSGEDSQSIIEKLTAENRRLKEQVAELETLVRAFESDQNSTSTTV
jgi:hypothetical protein